MFNKKTLGVIGLFILFIIPLVSPLEPTHIISNSEDWKDVYSTELYSNLQKIEVDFLTSTSHGKILLNGLNKQKTLQVVSSKKNPFVFNYPGIISSEGFKGVDEIEVENANLELIDELPEIQNFIVVGNIYGYNAIAVAPYAIKTKSWVFLADSLNVDQIDSILSKKNINKLIIYGYVDREVRDTLEKYNPEIIDEGDKFQDNIEITKRFLEINPTQQVILTNGEFIEKELMMGNNPILFTGRENVPLPIEKYLKQSEIKIGVLIGNELMSAATNIRRGTGISVMVKFARGARGATKGVSAVEGLDLFALPTPSLKMGIDSIKYNKLSGKLEITYKSEANVPLYLMGTITLRAGDEQIKIGDQEGVFLTPGNYKTITYDVKINSNQNIKAEIYTLFGETTSSMDRVLQAKMDVDSIEILDKCKLEDIEKIKYNKQQKEFIVYIKNKGEEDCWANIELKDVLVGYQKLILGSEKPELVPKGETKKVIIKQSLTNEDLSKNPFLDLTMNYGQRENSLVHQFKGKIELSIESFTITSYIILGLIIFMIFLIFLFFKRRKEEKEEGY